MKRFLIATIFLFTWISILSGCGITGNKSTSLATIYLFTTIFSALILIGYCFFLSHKEAWFLLLLSAVFVVNAGYFTLAISNNLEEALLANRIAYLGSVFLPMSILMIILEVLQVSYKKWVPGLLLCIGIVVFCIAASPGYSSIYYQEVFFEIVNGTSQLQKVYGPFHYIYLLYLLSYFVTMVSIIVHSLIKKSVDSISHAVILAIAVFVNISVWLIEQIVHINFEFLSVSYIITELFLLGLHIIILENNRLKNLVSTHKNMTEDCIHQNPSPSNDVRCSGLCESQIKTNPNEKNDSHPFVDNLTTLTKTEHMIFDLYISGKTTKEILHTLNITENTLKFHNKNIYSKLNVASRKQLIEIYHNLEK